MGKFVKVMLVGALLMGAALSGLALSAPAYADVYPDDGGSVSWPPRTPADCLFIDVVPTTESMARTVEGATLCLIQLERIKAGRPLLLWDESLATAAKNHSGWMVKHHDYDHSEDPQQVNPNDPTDRFYGARGGNRAEAEGYRWQAWSENIFFGGPANGSLTPHATAREIVAGWMHSACHKQNILDIRVNDCDLDTSMDGIQNDYPREGRGMVHTGVGVVLGTPEVGQDGATFTELFAKPRLSMTMNSR